MSPTKSLPSTPSYYKCLCSGIRWNPTLAFTAKLITSYCPFAPQACELLRTRILIHLCTLHRLFLLPSPHPLQELPSPPRKGYGFSTLLLTLREKAVTRNWGGELNYNLMTIIPFKIMPWTITNPYPIQFKLSWAVEQCKDTIVKSKTIHGLYSMHIHCDDFKCSWQLQVITTLTLHHSP